MPQLSVKVVNAEVVRKGLQDLEAEVPKIGRLDLYRAMQRAKTRLSKPAPKPSYPINWDSPKQKRAFFATDGFGRGIPTKRSDRYVKGFQIVQIENGYQLVNRVPYAKYVGGGASGAGQSNIHAGRWPLFRDPIEEEFKALPEAISKNISMYARSKGLAAT